MVGGHGQRARQACQCAGGSGSKQHGRNGADPCEDCGLSGAASLKMHGWFYKAVRAEAAQERQLGHAVPARHHALDDGGVEVDIVLPLRVILSGCLNFWWALSGVCSVSKSVGCCSKRTLRWCTCIQFGYEHYFLFLFILIRLINHKTCTSVKVSLTISDNKNKFIIKTQKQTSSSFLFHFWQLARTNSKNQQRLVHLNMVYR